MHLSIAFFTRKNENPFMAKTKPIKGVAVCGERHVPVTGETPQKMTLGIREAQRMGEFFSVLADPTRLRLLGLLASKEHCVCDLAAHLGMTDSAISHQLRALRAARLVSYRKEGRQVFYTLNDHHIHDLYLTVREHLAE
jgi:ArsR family transcriptional regulator, lead/cadmium/zinc/bismuth-responsive transcriptional repressor